MDKVFVIGRDPVPQLVRLSASEEFRAVFVALPGVKDRLCLEVDIDGPDCKVDIAGLYVCDGDDSLEMDITLKHNSGGSESVQQFLGVAGGASRALFNGLVYVAPGAGKTKARQESGFLSEEELFYMRSRGIPEKEARHLQKIAFLAPVLRRLPEDIAREVYESLS